MSEAEGLRDSLLSLLLGVRSKRIVILGVGRVGIVERLALGLGVVLPACTAWLITSIGLGLRACIC